MIKCQSEKLRIASNILYILSALLYIVVAATDTSFLRFLKIFPLAILIFTQIKNYANFDVLILLVAVFFGGLGDLVL